MMTPQEVASHAFSKATLGGYNMAMVDEFLDALTADYTALYNDNAILKNKLKVLSDTVEEYRATDVAMRKTLLAAQQMAESIVAEAEAKKSSLVQDAESAASSRIEELRSRIAAEEYRLAKAQEETAAYVEKLRALHDSEMAFLNGLSALVPPSVSVKNDPVADIHASLSGLMGEEPAPAAEEAEEEPVEESRPAMEELDPDATRRFEDLQFSRDYRIE
ncbi:MAG: DivIVA domain-containing protein [Oscillospiraceae bacterium]|nr:DivIVA domain-containing protein [Oscillospiraceae bacterium]